MTRGSTSTSTWIEAHGAQRVDLLAHFHRADFGGVGAAGASGHHHANDQHADLAQHQHRDHVDDIHVGTEGAETENALLRQNGADHESREHDDRHRAPADLFQMMHDRREAQPPRMRDRAERRQH
jgi:hypothetical protein